ncbi:MULTISPECIES: hypothetical protein [unclassified Acinetobacter]|uniref:hypothetical protein n=1 Tax=unclassified Acinetobacter TaxID=196816 RepID=UPI0025C6E7E4|nr:MULTISPECIES: hypothetical protein [unclassified Acinetobacter]
MNIFIKSAAILTVLLGSGLTQAANNTASIPMGVEVPKSCSFSNVSAGIVLPEDGSEAQGSFNHTCNIDGGFNVTYSLDSRSIGSPKVKNIDGISLPITARIKSECCDLSLDNGSQTINFYYSFLSRPVLGVVTAKLITPTTATTPAGVYTDTFRVNVNY